MQCYHQSNLNSKPFKFLDKQTLACFKHNYGKWETSKVICCVCVPLEEIECYGTIVGVSCGGNSCGVSLDLHAQGNVPFDQRGG